MSNDKEYNLLWTGGFDSTYMMCLLAKKEIIINPIYVLDRQRNSINYELNALKTLLPLIRNASKTKSIIKDITYVEKDDIPINTDVTNAFDTINNKIGLGSQYEWLGRLSKLYPNLYVGIEKGSVDGSFSKTVSHYGKLKHNDENYLIVDKDNSKNELITLFGNFVFPIRETTEIEMYKQTRSKEYKEIMSKIWFCHDPIDEKPCGFCSPCQTKVAHDMNRLLPMKARFRSIIYSAMSNIRDDEFARINCNKLFR